MSIFLLLLLIAVVGFVTWLLIYLIPMPEPMPKILIAVAVLVTVLLVLDAFGILNSLSSIRVGKIGSDG